MKKESVKLLFINLMILLLLVYSFDFALGYILSNYYFKQESGIQFRSTYAIEKTRSDILIFGSSRANHHYYPDIFEREFKLSYYNVGRDGNFIFYNYAVLKAILKRYTPKIIILDFVYEEFKQDPGSYDRISSLLPYYKSHPEMRSIIELKSKFERIKLLSNIYPYNSSIFGIIAGNSGFNKNRKSDIKGYVPLNQKWNKPVYFNHNSPKYLIDSLKLRIFESFINDCINSKVKLYVVCSPYLIKSSYPDYSVLLAKGIARNKGIIFFDYSKDTTFTAKPYLFADIAHLNDSGAILFSQKLAKDIKLSSFANH